MQKAVIRLKEPTQEIAREEIVETYFRTISNGLLEQIKSKDFSLTTELTPVDVRNMCVSMLDAYNRLYQKDNLFNSVALAQFTRSVILDIAEMAMHERIVAHCTTSVGMGLELMVEQLISKAEEMAEICDQIIAMKNGKV